MWTIYKGYRNEIKTVNTESEFDEADQCPCAIQGFKCEEVGGNNGML